MVSNCVIRVDEAKRWCDGAMHANVAFSGTYEHENEQERGERDLGDQGLDRKGERLRRFGV